MVTTSYWLGKLGEYAGELYVAAELSKRGILCCLLPKNFPEHDLMIGKKEGEIAGFVQVKSCHPDRHKRGEYSFRLDEKNEEWVDAADNEFVVLIYLGSGKTNENPRYWMAKKKEVGILCKENPSGNRERRFWIKRARYGRDLNKLRPDWENNWDLFAEYLPDQDT